MSRLVKCVHVPEDRDLKETLHKPCQGGLPCKHKPDFVWRGHVHIWSCFLVIEQLRSWKDALGVSHCLSQGPKV